MYRLKRKLDEELPLANTTTNEQTQAHYYLVGGFFCGPQLTAVIDAKMRASASKKQATAFTHILTNSTIAERPTILIAVFISAPPSLYCAMFDRFTGHVKLEIVTPSTVCFTPTASMWWSDWNTSCATTATTTTTTTTTVDSCPSFELTAELDCLYNFQPKNSSLHLNDKPLPNNIVRQITGHLRELAQKPSTSRPICVIPFLKRKFFDVVNLVGCTMEYVRIRISNQNVSMVRLGQITRVKRGTSELEIASPLWDVMDASALTDFTNSQFQKIRTRTLCPTDTHPHTITWSHTISFADGELCTHWMKFVRTKLSPQVCFKTPYVTVDLFHSHVAWMMFEAQLLRMESRNTPIEPRIMFHGVRGENVLRTVELIRNEGFDAKCTQNCVYGAGGTYCSPQLTCALEYTEKVSNIDTTRFVFVCMVVPGKVCLNGQNGQQLGFDQNAWCAHLSTGQQIYCAETILPFALLRFVP